MEIWQLTLQAQLTLNNEQAGNSLSDARHFNAVAYRLLGDTGGVVGCRGGVVTDNRQRPPKGNEKEPD
jgi:hypothetical protein